MFGFLRYLVVSLYVIWLGCMFTMGVFVARSLFANESGALADRDAIGDILGVLFHKMDVTVWITIPVILILLWIMQSRATSPRRMFTAAVSLLAIAWGGSVFSGTFITSKAHAANVELRKEFGSYDKAPKDDPRRKTFGALHGISMMFWLMNVGLGFGSLYCALQISEKKQGEI